MLFGTGELVTVRLPGSRRAAATPAPVQLFRETRQAAWAAARAAFPPRPAAVDWPATQMDRDQVLGMLRRAPFTVRNPGTQRWRFRGAALALTWLGGPARQHLAAAVAGQRRRDRRGRTGSGTAPGGWMTTACTCSSGWTCCRSG